MPHTELLSLCVLAILNSLLWVPVVIGFVKYRGLLQPEDYVTAPSSTLPDGVNRANRAHMNAVENLSPFAATVLVAAVLGVALAVVERLGT
jgi:uncharacterized MAPEG superfamily protein